MNALAEIRTVVTTTDRTPATITALERAGARLDAWQFESAGFAIQSNQLHAWVPAHRVSELAALPVVGALSLPVNGITDIGDETTEGDALLLADDVRSVLGFDGTGVRVGVISSGVPHRANVQTTADLPATITIDPVRSGALSDDEGTAMLEIVHDVAPGAQLFFSGFRHIGFDPQGNEITEYVAQDMVDSINWLVSQGVDVIVDDIQFFNEPAFTDGIVAQAANNAVAQGVTFVTAAGNRANRHYQGQFSNNGFGFQDFKLGAQIDDILNVNVAPGRSVEAWLHWSDPLGTSANDYNIWFIDLATQATLGTRGVVVQDGVGGNDNPLERAFWTNTSASAVQVGIVVQRVAGVDRELEIYVTPAGTMADDDATITDSMFGHKAMTSVITVGAIDAADPGTDTIREFSSRGPATVYTNFATQQSVARQSLDGAGINGVRTRVGELGFFDFPFFGTSAAAPHIAGIAALLLDINAAFTPAQVSSFLNNNTVDIDATGYDVNSGFGRFNALAAAYNAFTPALPDLVATSDWGFSATDNKTFDTTPTLTGTVPAGSFVQLYNGSVAITGANQQLGAGQTTYSITVPAGSALGVGTHQLNIRIAENSLVPAANRSQPSNSLPVTIANSDSVTIIGTTSFNARLTETLVVSGNNASGTSTLTANWGTSPNPPRSITKTLAGTVTITGVTSRTSSSSVTYINNAGTTNFNVNTGTANNASLTNWTVAVDGTSAASNVVFNTQVQNLAKLDIKQNGVATIAFTTPTPPATTYKVLHLRDLTIAGPPTQPTGKLDLTNNVLIWDYTGSSPEVQIRQWIIAGRGGAGLNPTWTGNGITSSTAASNPSQRSIGYADNALLPLGPYMVFLGQSVDNTTVLVRYTVWGDTNLDGTVNDDDVTVQSATYAPGVPNPSWANGDVDYNGFVDDDDVTVVGALYNPFFDIDEDATPQDP